MIRRMLTDLYAANLAYARRMVDGLGEDEPLILPTAGMNHPRWIIGHLAGTADEMVVHHLFGQPAVRPEGFDEHFGPRSVCVSQMPSAPSLVELMAMLDERHATVSERVRAATPDFFDRVTPTNLPEGFRKRFPTIGHGLIHTMISHENMHLGQLSAWRRTQGLPSV